MKRVVLITGVAGGIGRATAQTFSNAGWNVIGVDRRKDEGLPGIDLYIQADAASPEQIFHAAKLAEQRYDRLDALINMAAVQICKEALELTIEDWDEVMAVNVRAAFLFTQAVFPLLQQSRGCVVNVSSVHAITTSVNIAAYAASKGALTALTRALAIEFAPYGIRVNSIAPGAVDTPMLRAGLERGHLRGANIEELINDLGRKTVMGRVAEPAEIGKVILFLADNKQSSFVTGHSLVADGGATARLSTE